MDLREAMIWAAEARRRAAMRRAQSFGAALLPRMPAEAVRAEADDITAALEDRPEGAEAEAAERENAALIAERTRRAAEVLERRRGKAKPKRRTPRGARRI